MPKFLSKEAAELRTIADLATEFSLSVAEVRVLYEAERVRLMKGAKVGKYFSVFAVRDIREELTKRHPKVSLAGKTL